MRPDASDPTDVTTEAIVENFEARTNLDEITTAIPNEYEDKSDKGENDLNNLDPEVFL